MDDLKLIKKYYGEKMSHLCRELFPSILETEGLLFKLLSDNFYYSKFLYDDLIAWNLVSKFKEYIYSLTNSKERSKIIVDKNPYELMKEAGYTLYKCETEEDIQRFKKYYAPGEELCTFRGGRLNSCYVFFAVKKNVDEIKRENFKKLDRQDEYGTSVISIQFSKGNSNYLSIKNRYNHTVINPDATFSNNLDNIIPGLTYSFEREFGYKIEASKGDDFEIPFYVKTSNGKRYKYNYELAGDYYCPDNIVIKNGHILCNYLNKNRYLVFDYFILDLKEKKILPLDYIIEDSFVSTINGLNIDRIDIVKNEEGNKEVTFVTKEGKITITIDKQNRMISYYDDIIQFTEGVCFLFASTYLKDVQLLKMKKVPDFFIPNCKDINTFSAPLLEEVGECFLRKNSIKKVSFPSLKIADSSFMEDSPMLEEIDLPLLEILQDRSLMETKKLRKISIPNVKTIRLFVLRHNRSITEMDLPNLENAGADFMAFNDSLQTLNIPKLLYIPQGMLQCSTSLEHIYAPSATKMGRSAFHYNSIIKSFIAPNMSNIDEITLLTKDSALMNLRHLHLADKVEVGELFLGEKIENSLSTFEEIPPYGESQIKNVIEVGNIEGKGKINGFKAELSNSPKIKIL